MQSQVGERYRCSDPDCGCEIQITAVSRLQDETSLNENANDRSVGGAATGETGVGTLRNAEASGISTPGDFGSQGATGEGVFGTSGGGQRSTMSGRFGSSTGGLRSGATGSPASREGSSSSGSDDSAGFSTDDDSTLIEEESFFCFCGQPMTKTTGQTSSRAARA
jgi:hypothetical protein